MADVRIPVQTKYDGQAFRQAQQDAARLRRLQERHNRAVLQETRQQISEQRRLATLNRKLERDLAREAQQAATRQQRAAAIGAAAFAGATALAVEFGRESITAAKEQAAAEAQLAAAIRSTGGAAGLTAGELKKMAAELQSVTNFGDEATIRAQALLLTFTGIGRETFPRATRSILDVATALDKDLNAAALQVGKALNDPVRGLTALRESGIQFSKAQEDQIKTMVEAGRIADAQAVILAELERQFGGSAEAAREADQGAQALLNSYGDLQEAVGRLITPTGAFNELLIDQLDATTGALNALTLLGRAYGKLNETGDPLVDTLLNLDTLARSFVNPAGTLNQFLIQLSANSEEWADALQEVNQEIDDGRRVVDGATEALTDNTAAVEENSDAYEEAAKRLARVADIRRDAARELVDIEERAADDVADLWSDYWTDQEDAWQDHSKRLADLRKRAANDAEKSDRDLAKDLKRLDQDTQKQIARVQADADKQQRHEAKRRQVDVLADERLFNFDLQQLAADGQGNAIREAIERRAIEEQIAKEKAAVETQIEAEQRRDQITTIRDTAAERRAQLQEDHSEEQRLNQERLAEELAAEEEQYAERMIALRTHREERLAEIEAGRVEAVATLGEELAEMQELTAEELGRLVEMAGEFGEQFGEAFAGGIDKGLDTNERVKNLLGNDFRRQPGAGSGSPSPMGGPLQSFQFGGTVAGPIGKPTLAIVHGGETVTPPGKATNTFNVIINASGGVDQRRVEALFQEFVDGPLLAALS